MVSMFSDASSLMEIFLTGTPLVMTMFYVIFNGDMFSVYGASNFNGDISNWDTSSVTTMQ